MKIAHLAPFAPNRCGLYEACRDMVRADIFGGNEVYFVDAGTTENGKHTDGKVGQIDHRGDLKLETVHFDNIDNADILILHTGVPDYWIVRNQLPIIWVVHGRPHASFKGEMLNTGNSYSLYTQLVNWPRCKKMLYFWPEFTLYWKTFFKEKDLSLDFPVCDQFRFNPDGKKYKFTKPGEINVVCCDSEREDIDIFELVNCLLYVHRFYPKLKFHFFGVDLPLKNCQNILFGELEKLGCLGDIGGRMANMEEIYRSADLVISPNKIITRTICEPICCGTPVMAYHDIAQFVVKQMTPDRVKIAFDKFMIDKCFKQKDILKVAQNFSLKNYAEKMNKVYDDIKSWKVIKNGKTC